MEEPVIKTAAWLGDILFVNRGLYKHYGIYAGDNKVIHFAPISGAEINAEDAIIHETSLEKFINGGILEIEKKAMPRFSRQGIVKRARSQIGSKGYDLVFNNCEHFAYWCATGDQKSIQVNKGAAIAGTIAFTAAAVLFIKKILDRDKS